jgi:methyl-accepting chemotaxis protein
VTAIDVQIEGLANASQEQAAGLHQINQAMNALDQMTQKNAAMVEETAAVSQALAEGSHLLMQTIERFRLGSRQLLERSKPGETSNKLALCVLPSSIPNSAGLRLKTS